MAIVLALLWLALAIANIKLSSILKGYLRVIVIILGLMPDTTLFVFLALLLMKGDTHSPKRGLLP